MPKLTQQEPTTLAPTYIGESQPPDADTDTESGPDHASTNSLGPIMLQLILKE